MVEITRERLRSVRDALLAFSLANLCFITTWHALFFNEQFEYFKELPLNRQVLLGFALNLILLGFVAWRLTRWVRRAQSRLLYRVACVVAFGLFVIPADFFRTHFLLIPGGRTLMDWGTNPFVIAASLIVLFAIWHWPRFVLRAIGLVLTVLVPLVFLTFGKIGYYLLKTRPEAPPQLAAFFRTPTPSVEPRVLWIIYDELDQRLAFSNRPKDCPLPELDRVCAESLYATNAFPPAGNTILSLPALITGRYVIDAKPASRSELNITYADTTAPVGWSSQPTVFSRARELGFNTALVGWYHPYSRLFPSSLNFCAWYPYALYQLVRGRTLLGSMINETWALLPALQNRREHIDFYQKSLANSRNVVKDGRYGLMFFHLMGPHYPGIYNPRKGTFTLTEFSLTRGYFDNLQLTDKTMGILRREMEQTGLWDRTWVIISADHWWREARRYDGRLDHRVPFILKAPGKNPPMIYGAFLNTVITQHLILAILRKEISRLPEAAAWLETHKTPPSPNYDIMQTK
jgi:hypothetical protein